MNPIKSLKNIKPIKLSIYILLSLALLFTLTCDIYDKSIPDYLDTYTNKATVGDHSFTGGTLSSPQGVPYPNLILHDSAVITLKLRNPKNYEILTTLEYHNGSSWVSFEYVSNDPYGDYSNVVNQSLNFPGTTFTVKYDPTTQIRITINNAEIGQAYKLRIKLQDRETKREFDSYELPVFKCTNYPEPVGLITVRAGASNIGVVVDWQQLLRSGTTIGDHADANRLVISCSDLGVSQTYTRELNPVTSLWGSWSPGGINETGNPFFSITLGALTPLVEGRSYIVVLRFSNEAGVVTEISEALTAAAMDARIIRGGLPNEYPNLQDAFDSMDDHSETSATITVLRPIMNQAPVIISGSKTINLVSQGANTIQLAATGGSLFTIDNGITLRIGDSSANGGASSGALTLGGVSNTAALITVKAATLEMYNGATISGNTGIGGGVSLTNTLARFYMYGGNITGNNATNGAGVSVGSGGQMTMSNGSIAYNTATASGGGVYVSGGGKFEMNGSAAIQVNNASTGGGVSVATGDAANAFTMNGGTIQGNSATTSGGGVYSAVSFTMSSGVIYGSGEAVGLRNTAPVGASVTIAGGTAQYSGAYGTDPIITNNETLPPYVATVRIDGVDKSYQTLEAAFVSVDNRPATITVLKPALELSPYEILNLSGTKNITLVSQTTGTTITLASGVGNNGSMFTIPSGVTLNIGSASGPTLTLKGKSANNAALVFVDSGATLTLNATATIAGNQNNAGGNPLGNNGGGIYNSGTVVINGGTIGGYSVAEQNNATNGAGIYQANGTLTINSGAIRGNVTFGSGTSGKGGGVCAIGGQMFMNGGTIEGNVAGTDGGGVYLDGGSLTLDSGIIYGTDEPVVTLRNIATTPGVGDSLYIASGTAVYGAALGSNSIISGNGGTSVTLPEKIAQVGTGVIYPSLGAAIANAPVGALGSPTPITILKSFIATTGYTLTGRHVQLLAESSGVTVTTGPGGFALFNIASGASLTLGSTSSGSITLSGNNAPSMPGRVGVSSAGTFVMNDNATIRDFNNQGNGGGVYISAGNMTMNGGAIASNDSAGLAGDENGGGVYFNGTTFSMSGGSIEGNTAFNGAGVYIAAGAFNLTTGAINNNTAAGSGGGVYKTNNGAMTFSGNIQGNTASQYGGGVYIDIGQLNVSGGTMAGNSATGAGARGGGVYVQAGSFSMSGGTIYGNAEPNIALRNTATSANSASFYAAGGTAVYSGAYTSYGNDIVASIPGGTNSTLPEVIVAMVNIGGTETGYSVFAEAFSNTAIPSGSTATVTIIADIAPQAPILITGTKIITLTNNTTPRTITLGAQGSLFTVGSGSGSLTTSLTIEGDSPINTLTLVGIGANNASLVTVNGGTFTMNSNVIISGNTNSGNGGGVSILNGGEMMLDGGRIGGVDASTQNSAVNGGGVNISGTGSTLNMASGTIGGTWAGGGNAACNIATSPFSGGGGGVYVENGGKLEMPTGSTAVIEGNSATAANSNGGGVYMTGTGTTFVMNGGRVGGTNAATQNRVGNSGNGGGVYVNGGTFTLSDGVVGSDTWTGGGTAASNLALSEGGGVYIANGTFEMPLGSTAKIKNNIANMRGGGVAKIAGTVTLTSGSIETNAASSLGGGVYLNATNFTMNGGTVSNNTAVHGGGFYLASGSTFTMTNGSIQGNNASGNGGGVHVDVFGGSGFVMSGGTVYGKDAGANSNTAGTTGSGAALFVAGTSTSLATYSGTYATTYGPTIISATGFGASYDLPAKEAEAGLSIVGDIQTEAFSTLQAAFDATGTGAGSTSTVTVLKNIPNQSPISITKTAPTTINLVSTGVNKVSLPTGSVFGSLFTVSDNVTLNIGGPTSGLLTLEGKSNNTAALITVNNGGILVLNNNAIIENNESTGAGGGGGVLVTGSPSTFTMNGGIIRGNRAGGDGGGVYVVGGGVFDMSGSAVISGNYATGINSMGGGVYIQGIFTMSSGTIGGAEAADGNSASDGGGVYVGSGTFTFSAGTISNNTATNDGGGVGFRGLAFNMSGSAAISDNSATNGGGVYVLGTGTFDMTGGTIENNTASSGGGGVYVSGGTFTMSNGQINDNSTPTTVGRTGGGVHIQSGNFTLSGGIMQRNRSYSGGGVSVSSTGTFDMTGGTIGGTGAANTASNCGGGVYVTGGTFTMSNGTIGNNTASSGGGGVYLVSSGIFNMSGGTINGNTASTYAGGVYNQTSNMTMTGGTISGNTATSGGGLYLNSTTFTMSAGARVTVSASNNDIYLVGTGTAINVSDNFTPGSDKVARITPSNYSPTMVLTGTAVGANYQRFDLTQPAGQAWGITAGGMLQEITIPSSWTPANLQDAIDAASSGATFNLPPNNVNLTEPITMNKAITFNAGSGIVTFTRSGTAHDLFVIGNGGKLTLSASIGSELVITGQGATGASQINVESGGELVMGDRVKITAPSASTGNNFSGVTVSGGTFNMTGGEISNIGRHGGVFLSGGGIFNMSGGIIIGCVGANNVYGGGVTVTGNSTFTMSGTAEISNCYYGGSTAGSGGGGVRVVSTGTFIMEGGTIRDNYTINNTYYGGGVNVAIGATFIKRGGTIYGDATGAPNWNRVGGVGPVIGANPGLGAAVYCANGAKYRDADAGPTVRLYMGLAGSTVDPLDSMDTAANWDQ